MSDIVRNTKFIQRKDADFIQAWDQALKHPMILAVYQHTSILLAQRL